MQMIHMYENRQLQSQALINPSMTNILQLAAFKPKKPIFKPHSKFNEEEDARLRELVNEYGDSSWIQIAAQMPGRNSRQCRERWLNYLSPRLNTNEWTKEEDDLLLEKQKELGTSWVRICKFFKGRTDQMCKNRFFLLQRKAEKKSNKKRNNSAQSLSSNAIGVSILAPISNAFQQPYLPSSFSMSSNSASPASSPVQFEPKNYELEQKKLNENKKGKNTEVPLISESTDLNYLDCFYQESFDNFMNFADDGINNIESDEFFLL